MNVWLLKVIAAAMASIMMLLPATASAPKQDKAVSEKITVQTEVKADKEKTETKSDSAENEKTPAQTVKAELTAPKQSAKEQPKTETPEKAAPSADMIEAYTGETLTDEEKAGLEELMELYPQFKEIVQMTLNGKFMSSQNPRLIAFAQPFYKWLSNNKYFDINIVYDEETNTFRDDGQRGIVAIGFDYDATQGIYYSAHDPWMRNLGYCELYDKIGPHFGYTLDTKRFKFDYDGYEWMFQVWKGEYLYCATGAEMGLYYREPGSTITDDFYNVIPDELMIDMEMTLYHNGKYKFKRAMEKTWWQTGFVFCYMCEPEEVLIEARVEWPNEEMRDAFLVALEGEGYVLNETYTVDGNIVSFAY